MRRIAMVVALPLLLAGCGLPPAVTAIAYLLDGASLIGTGKTMGDHALSAVAQKDCAMWRVAKGELICQGPDERGKPSAIALAARVSDYPDEPAPEPVVEPAGAIIAVAAADTAAEIARLAAIAPAAGPLPPVTVEDDWRPVLTLRAMRRLGLGHPATARRQFVATGAPVRLAQASHAATMDAAVLRARQRLQRFVHRDGIFARGTCPAGTAACRMQLAALSDG